MKSYEDGIKDGISYERRKFESLINLVEDKIRELPVDDDCLIVIKIIERALYGKDFHTELEYTFKGVDIDFDVDMSVFLDE
jgi:hypothetical protein